ncbi:cellulase family glycosylhydrolase [Aurantibacter sp.]|uniref:glycoside hydrolase family 5 protein n=1 Tax=Aurantibacter sp. TaxID=2807103 RepID=UPI003266D4DE
MSDSVKINRRSFVKKTSLAAGGILVSPKVSVLKSNILKNPLPRWRGFNFLNFFSPDPSKGRAFHEDYFKWMADWGFDFVRLPMAYPYYLKFDRSRDITPNKIRKIDRKATDRIENVVYLAHKHGLHVSLNLHRAPGFCVNAGFNEPYNLWEDQQALDDFCLHWKFWAKRFKNVSEGKISFDLLNEPCTREDMNDQFSKRAAIPGELYRKMAIAASETIRNPNHLIIADGNNIGSEVIPEITDLNIGQSCRGYNPGIISHYKAPWVFKDSKNLPIPKWPGQVGDQYLSVAMLEDMYKPWIDLIKQGVGVHCGECGCYNKTPHDVFLAWFEDLMSILKINNIGYALWEFDGTFGILNSGRSDVNYEDWYGHKLDRKLLNLLMKY